MLAILSALVLAQEFEQTKTRIDVVWGGANGILITRSAR
jgi:hypothetical protein